MAIPTTDDLELAKANLDAYDAVINGSVSTTVTSPAGQSIDTVAKAISTLKSFTPRGPWTQSTVYALKDLVSDPDDDSGVVYVRVEAGSSPGTGTFQDEYDEGDGPWSVYQGLRSFFFNVEALRAAAGAYDNEYRELMGYYEPGDGGGGPVYWDGSSTADDNNITVYAVTGVATGRWRRSVESPNYMNVKWAGAKADGTDAYPAFLAAHDALPDNGGRIYVPGADAAYRLSDTLNLLKTTVLYGDGRHSFGSLSATVLEFAPNINGIIVNRQNTIDNTTRAEGTSADESVIEHMCIRSSGSSAGSNRSGVWFRARATIQHCLISDFGEHGLKIVADNSGGADTLGNANGWEARHVRFDSNLKCGMFVSGADANAGLGLDLDATQSGEWGIYDNSFLGNTYIACHATGGTLGPYKTDNPSSCNVLLGCYSESGQPPSSCVSPTLILGGLHAAGIAGNAPFFRANQGVAVSSRGLNSTMTSSGGDVVTVTLGGDPSNGDIFTTDHSVQAPALWRLRYNNHDLHFLYENSDSKIAFQITGAATTKTFGRSDIVPFALSSDRVFVGGGNEGRHISSGGSPPSSGLAGRGDLRLNIDASAGGAPAWTCTTAGTNGSTAVWKEHANTDP